MGTAHFSGSSFQILGILLRLNLGGFSFQISFSKRAVQMFVRNISWLKIAVGIHESAPQPQEWTQ